MENLTIENQKNISIIPNQLGISPNNLGKTSYVHKGKHSHISLEKNLKKNWVEKPKKKKSEKLKIRYRTQEKLVSLLEEVGEEKMADSMALCGRRFNVLTCGEHIASEAPNHRCNVRFCALCASRRSGRYKNKYLPYALAFNELMRKENAELTPCLLTLTQRKIKGERFADGRERILKSFRRFIRHDFFDEFFDGGIFTIENAVSEEGNHTHLHCVVFRSKFIDHKILKEHWAMVSPGAENLNIKRLDSVENGLTETLKYVSKPQDVENFTKQNMLELLEVKGKRMLDTFGRFRKFCKTHELTVTENEQKEEKPKLEEGQCCTKCTGKQSFLFSVTMTAKERIKFYENLEQTFGSPPNLTH